MSQAESWIERVGKNDRVALSFKETALRRRFGLEGDLTNPEKGYVSIPWVNQEIDPVLQGYAADIISAYFSFKGIKLDKIVGVPNMGIPLATVVSERLNVPLAPGRKGDRIPGAWNSPILVDETVASFTTGEVSKFVFNGVRRGDRVLIVDDFIAWGDTLGLIIQSFQRHKVEPYVAVYCAKLFQDGVVNLRNLKVEPFYVLGIEKNPDNSLFLSPPHFQITRAGFS